MSKLILKFTVFLIIDIFHFTEKGSILYNVINCFGYALRTGPPGGGDCRAARL